MRLPCKRAKELYRIIQADQRPMGLMRAVPDAIETIQTAQGAVIWK